MTRVLVLCEFGSLNGGEQSLLAVAPLLRELGFDLAVAAPPLGPLADALRALRVPLVPLETRIQDSRSDLAARRLALSQLVTTRRPDVLHANSLAMSRLSGPVAASLGLASIGHLRDIMRIRRAVADDLNCHTRLLAVSHAVGDWYAQQAVDAERVLVAYNGVSLQRFRPSSPTGYLADELGLPRTAVLVLTIGQVILRKGLDVLLRAASGVLHHRSDVHFLVVGRRFSEKAETVRYEESLHRLALTCSRLGHVHFLGVRSDVDRMLSEAALLVHPARQEPLGRVLLEAAAAGTAIVATAVGGTPEIFPSESQAAVLVPPDDPPALADAILRVLDDPALRGALGASARRIAEDRFSDERAAKALADHYRQTLGHARR